MSLGDFAKGYRYMLLYHLRTIVYTGVTCVAIFAVWYTGERSNSRIHREAVINCRQDLILTEATNDLNRSIKKFLVAAREARLKARPKSKSNLQAAHTYGEIIRHIKIVPPPVCSR